MVTHGDICKLFNSISNIYRYKNIKKTLVFFNNTTMNINLKYILE